MVATGSQDRPPDIFSVYPLDPTEIDEVDRSAQKLAGEIDLEIGKMIEKSINKLELEPYMEQLLLKRTTHFLARHAALRDVAQAAAEADANSPLAEFDKILIRFVLLFKSRSQVKLTQL